VNQSISRLRAFHCQAHLSTDSSALGMFLSSEFLPRYTFGTQTGLTSSDVEKRMILTIVKLSFLRTGCFRAGRR